MSSKKIAEFPDVEAKLQKPSKQSAFERQRAEAEAKRAREAAETAAVLKEFEASFEDDNGFGGGAASRFGPSQGAGTPTGPGFGGVSQGGPGAQRRHFGTPKLKSGPGSLGPVPSLKSGPGSLGPAPGSFGKKRGFDAFRQDKFKDKDGRLGFDERGEPMSVSKAFNTSDDEEGGDTDVKGEEKAVARPTLRLSQVPPGTSPATIKSWIPASLTVENVKILPPAGPSTERKCTVAIVVLSQDTPATDIDAVVSSLQNRYLGYGFYLSLHRHLSSAVTSSITAPSQGNSSAASQPFGAKPVAQDSSQKTPATQQAFHRGFAPPSSYGPNAAGSLSRSGILHVLVKPPNDVQMLQLINKTIESVLEHGPEFEALLMSRSDVQKEEKWAWIWDARSEGGIWYRWRLWEIVTGSTSSGNKAKYLPLFDGSSAWKVPEKRLPFEYVTSVDEFVSDPEYNSSDDEDADDEPRREQNGGGGDTEKTFLNPLDKAKLTHLLSRLPTALSRIRKGDIARVTTFALLHASRGADEVADMIVSNIERPFALTAANPDVQRNGKDAAKQREASEVLYPSRGASPALEDKTDKEGQDNSGASLIGLYAVSDILSSSSTSGVRHAWRFRQILESALKERKVFEALGLLAEKHNWGRLKAEKWKRSVGMILNLWEGWCVFPAESQELFSSTFDNPPSSKANERAEEEEIAKRGRWKAVEKPTPGSVVERANEAGQDEAARRDDDVEGEPIDEEDVPGEPMDEEDVPGEPMDEEDDPAGEPMDEEDVEGEPMVDDDVEAATTAGIAAATSSGGAEGAGAASPADVQDAVSLQMPSKAAGQSRKRMRAVDMFADSGESDTGI